MLTNFNAVAGSAAVQGNQVYGPYGNQRYSQGAMGTNKGFTGQYADATGLDYYNARYYDPVVGRFLSADVVQGNMQGMDPYDYVGGNPETMGDPTGRYYSNGTSITQPGGAVGRINDAQGTVTTITNTGGDGIGINWAPHQFLGLDGSGLSEDTATFEQARQGSYNPYTDPQNNTVAKIGRVTGLTDLQKTWSDPHASTWDKVVAIGKMVGKNANNALMASMILGGPEDDAGLAIGEDLLKSTEDALGDGGLGKLADLNIEVSQKGLNQVIDHLSQANFLEEDGTMAPENQAMIDRLREALTNGKSISGADASFYMHELYESTLTSRGALYDVAHDAAIARYGVSPFSIYHPDVIQAFPELFNNNWFTFWGITR